MAYTALSALLLLGSASAQLSAVTTLTTSDAATIAVLPGSSVSITTVEGGQPSAVTTGTANAADSPPANAVTTISSAGVVATGVTATTLEGPFPVVTAQSVPSPNQPDFAAAAASIDDISTLLGLLKTDRLSSVLSLFSEVNTVLAPSNQALEVFLKTEAGQRFRNDDEFAVAVLRYHSLLGVYQAPDAFPTGGLNDAFWIDTHLFNDTVRPNVGAYQSDDNFLIASGSLEESQVVQANVKFDSGYIHVIDRVLTLPGSAIETLSATGYDALIGALQQSTLTPSDLVVNRGITILAPSDQAFENIGSALSTLSPQDLTDILSYHILLPAPYYAQDFKDGQQLKTLGGSSVTVSVQQGTDGSKEIFINGARVVQPNVPFIDGVVHGIDEVLNPANANATPSAGATAGQPQFSGAMSVGSLGALTSGVPAPTTTMATMGMQPSSSAGAPEQQLSGAAGPMATSGPLVGMLAAGGAIMAML